MSEVMNDAQQKLVEDNLKLVWHVLRKYYPSLGGDEELASCGTYGLCMAALRWDASKSNFTTFACACISNAIRNELRSRQKRSCTISIDTPLGDGLTIEDTLYEEEPHEVDYSFMDKLTPSEKKIFDLRSDGYSVTEIESITGYDHRKVLRLMRNCKAKYRKCN